MIALMDSNNTHSSQELIPSSKNHQQQVKPHPPIKISIPLNGWQRVKTIKNPYDANRLVRKSTSRVTTHRIDDWIIRESLEPFPQKENKSSSMKQVFSNKSDVRQWNIDDVCLFFEQVLGTNCYTPIIQEHLIDGIALLLLKDEHLIDIFHMQLQSRIKLLNRINKL